MLYDLAVIGGGAAGLAAAVSAARAGERVLVLEAGSAVGKKILASGNGRCNLMNTGKLRYYGDTDFAGRVLQKCGAGEQAQFWRGIGLITVADAENRTYPVTFHSASVLGVLKSALQMNGVSVVLNAAVSECGVTPDRIFRMEAAGAEYKSRRMLVATGGPAGRKQDGLISGYEILRRFGHRIIPLRPALVPMTAETRGISGLSGIRVRCGVTLIDPDNKPVFREHGELLFTDYGVSGICAMQCGRFIGKPGYRLELDLVRDIFGDEDSLKKEIRFRKTLFAALSPEVMLTGMLQARLSYAVMKQAGLALRGETAGDLDEERLDRIAWVLRHYRIGITGTRGMEDAQVTAGGAECGEFNPENMESGIVPGLYAAGEIMNVDGDCGGYNLMFAFGSGILAGLDGKLPAAENRGGIHP